MLSKATNIYARQSLLGNLKSNWSILTCQMERKVISECRGVKIIHILTRKWFLQKVFITVNSSGPPCFCFSQFLNFISSALAFNIHPSFPPFSLHSLPSFLQQIFFKYRSLPGTLLYPEIQRKIG